MRIGLLTYYSSNVFGGYWQAYSHISSFKAAFDSAEVFIIPVAHTNKFAKLKGLKKTPRYILPSLARYSRYGFARRAFLQKSILSGSVPFYNHKLLYQFCANNGIDLLVTGGDTCLDMVDEDARQSKVPVYWTEPMANIKHVFFSSSCGGLTIDKLSLQSIAFLKKSLSMSIFSGFRDSATKSLFEAINPCGLFTYTPDPAYSAFSFIKNSRQVACHSDERCCLISVHSPRLINTLSPILEKTYRLKAINIPHKKINHTVFPGPRDQINLIANATLLITSSFHETIAAAIFGVPFIAVERSQTSNRQFGMSKLSDLCQRLGATHQYVDECHNLLSDTANVGLTLSKLIDTAESNILSIQLAAVEQSNIFNDRCRDLSKLLTAPCRFS